MQTHPKESPAEVAAARTLQGFNGPEAAQTAKNQQIQALGRELGWAEIQQFAHTYPAELALHMFPGVSVPERDAILRLMFRPDFGPGFRDHCLEVMWDCTVYRDNRESFKLAVARHKLEMEK